MFNEHKSINKKFINTKFAKYYKLLFITLIATFLEKKRFYNKNQKGKRVTMTNCGCDDYY